MPHWRYLLAWSHDIGVAAAAWTIAYFARFPFPEAVFHLQQASAVLLVTVAVQGAIFWALGLYQRIWRYMSLQDGRQLLIAIGLAAVAAPVVLSIIDPFLTIPRSILLLQPLLMTLFIVGSRVAYAMWSEHRQSRRTHRSGRPVIIVGAGSAAARLLDDLDRSAQWRAVALLDDDPVKIGRIFRGLDVVDRTDAAVQVARRLGVSTVIVAIPSAPHEVRRRIIEPCKLAGLEVLTVPSFAEIVGGTAKVGAVREVEIEDLLGRDPIRLDEDKIRYLVEGKTMMVTGAGGSIGSELCRQIVRFRPQRLVLFEVSEFALYRLADELNERFPGLNVVPLAGDVKDVGRVDQVLDQHRPSVIFHAAAYKHVPLMEEHNCWEAVRNNALGTWVVSNSAMRHGVEAFVMVSTDKAVNPTSVMGASKRLAEMICEAHDQQRIVRHVIVRFGNVLGSAGSVIPKFQAQIARGGPITVTHPDVIRYFMSIQEAAQLVLQAGATGKGGAILVLDMGQPVRILDLAKDMIRMSGLRDDEIPIEIVGLRPGEKLYEELLNDEEATVPSTHPKLRIANSRPVDADLASELIDWLNVAVQRSDAEVRRDLRRWVPEYRPSQRPPLVAVEAVASPARVASGH